MINICSGDDIVNDRRIRIDVSSIEDAVIAVSYE
jgi:hypothetical protein